MVRSKLKLSISIIGIFTILILLIFGGGYASYRYTSTDAYCVSCHVHPQASVSWEFSMHNKDSVQAHCTDCHLPPKGSVHHFSKKVSTGLHDLYCFYFRDSSSYNWESKSQTENAIKHTFESSCKNCHKNLFKLGQSKEADQAHLYYSYNDDNIHCINCHIDAGHYSEIRHNKNPFFSKEITFESKYLKATEVFRFESFTELVPESNVSFEMMAIPGGRFKIGSNRDNIYANENEFPSSQIYVDSFFMGKYEVSWDEYMLFLSETESEGRDVIPNHEIAGVDAISGPTPPWGDPTQGWGMEKRPAITMTHHAAQVYCKWLSNKTGKQYRLPTEAEWEYACRAGSEGDYFFPGDPVDFEKRSGLVRWFFGDQDMIINNFVTFNQNANQKTKLPDDFLANSFGLVNMLGNVKEFCSDYYHPQIYNTYRDTTKNPKGLSYGKELVVRGGSFKSNLYQIRSAFRDHTHHDFWLKTDPQIPKSIWWYSDCNDVGFRVVCEYEHKRFNGGLDE
ncbi:MAG: SUMF1/EgtB/PvdO family nonheme iron enzyme [Bacteroidales bacterium]|nr:SUMF1/EgtB/PvdO family nonheme iron enzyme [Bacteroidales bacterium]